MRAAQIAIASLVVSLASSAHATAIITACTSWFTGNIVRESAEDVIFAAYGAECGGITSVSCNLSNDSHNGNARKTCFWTTVTCAPNPNDHGAGVDANGPGPISVGPDGRIVNNSTAPDYRDFCGTDVNLNLNNPLPPKNNGKDDCPTCNRKTESHLQGNPINIATGNKFQEEVDYPRVGDSALEFVRYYNSLAGGAVTTMGANWRNTWSRSVLPLPWGAMVNRPDGKVWSFQGSSVGTLTSEADATYSLKRTTSGFEFTTSNEEVETYDTNGILQKIVDRGGRETDFIYSNGTGDSNGGTYLDPTTLNATTIPLTAGLLIRVVDYGGRTMSFGYYGSGLLGKMIDPTGAVYVYTYGATSTASDASHSNLLSVSYPGASGGTGVKQYLYDELTAGYVTSTTPASSLTGIVDEQGIRYATFKYNGVKAIWNSPGFPDTSDECEYGTGGVLWRSAYLPRSSSVRQSV